ncbi:GroES-like protein [Trichoderma longibrachiatum]|uniref:GroES-like protein n=1 Tax=Trichoderma longibrachiatum ATCC 18648 TaxID=983965 RepID=A0A2T4C4H4_TRILO|nr:GroES-like protein [Trichoderma longibrachiatum ATCC 18648]
MSLPKTYKAMVTLEANAPFTQQELPLQLPGPNQVLVKVLACGVCSSDVSIISGHVGPVFPRVTGHELVGDVVAVGDNVTRITVGQRVGGPWHGGHDGTCRQCQRAQFQYCANQAVNGVSFDGGYAEYVLLRAEAVVRVPKEVDAAEIAPLLCAGVTAFNGIRKLHVEQGGIVVVNGLGGLGHLAVQYANKMGYEVIALSSGDDKAGFAKDLGAHHYINTKASDAVAEILKLGGADIIVQTAPDVEMMSALVEALAPGGKLLNLCLIGPVPFDTTALVRKGASVHGWASGHAIDSEEAVHFAVRHGIRCMIQRYPLAEAQKAVDDLIAGKPRFRNVLVMDQ